LPKVVGAESRGVKGERGQSTGVEKEEGETASRGRAEEKALLDLAEKEGVRGFVSSAIVVLPPSVLELEIC